MANSNIPATMRAILQPNKDSKNLILTTSPVPRAKVDSHEHLIRVHTTALTNGELLWPKNFPVPDPNAKELIPCYDLAGTVITASLDSPFQTGDEVYARTNYYRTGCGREYTIALTEELALKPRRLTWAEAATVPMSAQTAWQALFIHAGLEAKRNEGARGKRVFVTAASGGVGVWAVQLARWAGAEVVGTCGPENVAFVKSLGASEVIDYETTDVKGWATVDESRMADVVIDCIGRKSLEDAWWVVKDGGVLVSIFQPPDEMKPAGFTKKDVKNLFFVMQPDAAQLSEVTKLVEEGQFLANLDSVFPLDQFKEAFKRADSGKTRGKVVLDMDVSN